MMTLNRACRSLPVEYVLWGRCGISLLAALPYVSWRTLSQDLSWNLARGVGIALAQLCTYSAYRLISLHNASLIGTTGPLFTAFMAYIFLKEALNAPKILALTICYTGGLLAAYHGDLGVKAPLGMALALLGNVSAAGVGIMTRVLAARQHSAANTIVFGVSVPFVLLSGVLAVSWWGSTGSTMMALMLENKWHVVALGLVGVLTQASTFQANRHAPASFLASLEYVRWVLFIIIGTVIFHEEPTRFDIVGGVLILVGSVIAFVAQGRRKP